MNNSLEEMQQSQNSRDPEPLPPVDFTPNAIRIIKTIPKAEAIRAKEFYAKPSKKELTYFKKISGINELGQTLYHHYKREIYAYRREFDEARISVGGEMIDKSDDLIPVMYSNLIPDEILDRFSGHGITRGSLDMQLTALLSVLTSKEVKGDFGRLGIRDTDNADMRAFCNGAFMLISKIDKHLTNSLNIDDLGGIIVNGQLEPLTPVLRELYPKFTFLTAWEFPKWAKDQSKSKPVQQENRDSSMLSHIREQIRQMIVKR